MIGPKLNSIEVKQTNRDPLGTEGVTTNIGAEIQKIIISPTDQAIYWIFYHWLYYSFHHFGDPSTKTKDAFRKHLEKQEKFFVLAQLLNNFKTGISGNDNASKYLDEKKTDEKLSWDFYMLKSSQNFGYYASGLRTMGLICNDISIDEKSPLYVDKVSKGKGQSLGEVIEKKIMETEYYKTYLNSDINEIPKRVLIEFGMALPFDLNGCDEIKQVFNEILYDDKYSLMDITNYLSYLHLIYDFKDFNAWKCLHYFYDQAEYNITVPANLIDKARECEILSGRIIFRYGLESIWSYMMFLLEKKSMTKSDWIDKSLEEYDEKELQITVDEFLEKCNIDSNERNTLIKSVGNKNSTSVIDGMKLMLSVYMRFNNKAEYAKQFDLLANGDEDGISLLYWFDYINKNKNTLLKDFLYEVIDKFMIKQQWKVAFSKLRPYATNRNKYYDPFNYQLTNGVYTFNNQPSIGDINVRPVSAYKVAITLGKISEEQL